MSEVSLVDGHIDNGMSDEDIIKALECCKEAKLNQDCLDLECPFATEYGCNIDVEELRNAALDLINRQKAEIEKLKEDNNFHIRLEALLVEQRDGRDKLIEQIDTQNDELRMKLKTAKTEAIKEFAERLKKESSSCVTSANGYEIYETKSYTIMATTIDKILREMTESK